ncbi:MAG TPA: hypothetical protein VK155_04745 [Bacteroidales bacterium]|jgi:hypothetical protein|nr:hypothetical protein [Bacteroidales bacterium]
MEQGNRLEHISIIPRKDKPFSAFNERLKIEFENIICVVADKRAVPSLIELLDDDGHEIRWIAAESLIRVGRKCIIPILQEIRDGKQFHYPRKVHYVLESLLTRKERKELSHLLASLDSYPYMSEIAPLEASVALRKIFGSGF